jgi:3-carboxy-cis,cis-muconate cycloisomerase
MPGSQSHAHHPARLFDALMVDDRAAALLSDVSYVRCMMRFEAALARAEASVGLIPSEAAEAITRAVDTIHADELEAMAAAVAEGTARAGTPVIPFVKLLTARTDAAGHPYVHWGATTQDVMDTALTLQLRSIVALLGDGLAALGEALAEQARRHRGTPMVARTVLQHALPTTFGLKAAGWLDMVTRHRQRLGEISPRILVLQFGGAAGTLASLGGKGAEVGPLLAGELGLSWPATPWHGARDRIGEAAAFCGLLCGSLGKIGRDVALLMQTDVAEAAEPAAPGRGGSSTMPHKRNPVLGAVMIGAAISAPGLVATILAAQMHEHERAAGPAHAEWRTLPELLRITTGSLAAAVTLIEGLQVDDRRMCANLDVTQGLVMAEAVMMALAGAMGRLEAHHLVEGACRRAVSEGRHLREILSEEKAVTAQLDPRSLAELFEPRAYLGSADAFIDAALSAHAALPNEALP